MQLKPFFAVFNEAGDTMSGGGGSGSEGELNVDIDAASDAIGAGLGFGGDDTPDPSGDDTLNGSATPSKEDKAPPAPIQKDAGAEVRQRLEAAAKLKTDLEAGRKMLTEKKVDFTGKIDEQVLELVKANTVAPVVKDAPKSWKKELHADFAKLPPSVQDYVIQREAQVEDGFKRQASAVQYAEAVFSVMTPHEGLLKSQGIQNHVAFLDNMVQAHVVLSSHPDAARNRYAAQILQTYGLDPVKVGEAFALLGSTVQPQESPEQRQLRTRLDKLETERKTEHEARYSALKAETAAELAAFKADPAHPYFVEVEGEIALFLADPSITLDQAYERAVYANPVTRAKELERLRQEAVTKATTEAEAKAAAALKARGTKIRGEEHHRASPDLVGTMDQTLRATYKDISNRT